MTAIYELIKTLEKVMKTEGRELDVYLQSGLPLCGILTADHPDGDRVIVLVDKPSLSQAQSQSKETAK